MSDLNFHHVKKVRGSRIRSANFVAELLERRQLLSDSGWLNTPITSPTAFGPMQLLPTGKILMQQAGTSNAWYTYSPDATGGYANGTWSNSPAIMDTSKQYFGSNVLPNGKFFVVGGEYSSAGGFTNTAELYDPSNNHFSTLAPATLTPPTTQFGDDPTEVLPSGMVLGGYLSGPQTFLYNPSTNKWSNGPTKMYNDQSDEETWIKLPDGSILTYDIFASLSQNSFLAERYIPSLNKWIDASNVDPSNPPGRLTDPIGDEMGPATLLPNGDAMFFGADSQINKGGTAIYDYRTNTWSAGPKIPNNGYAGDSPGALLPNGDFLFKAGDYTVGANGHYVGHDVIFDFDPNYQSDGNPAYTDVTPTQFSFTPIPLHTYMAVLPTGQIMLSSDRNNQIDIFTETGSPQAAWKPRVTDIFENGNGTQTLEGTQLNGISEGALWGDDNEAFTNFPLVELQSALGGDPFLPTSGWSSVGVQTGNLVESVQFGYGSNTGPIQMLKEIGNGISSPEVLNIQMSSSINNVTLRQAPGGAGLLQVLNNGSVIGQFVGAAFSSIIVSGANSGSSSLNVDYNTGGFFSTPVTFDGGIGKATDTLTVTDSSGSVFPRNWVVNSSTITASGTGILPNPVVTYNEVQNIILAARAAGGEAITVVDTEHPNLTAPHTTLQIGTNDSVNVQADTTLLSIDPTHVNGLASVEIGSLETVQTIKAIVSVGASTTGTVNLTVNDSQDSVSRNVVVHAAILSGLIQGLSPANIQFTPSDTSALTIETGTVGDKVNVQTAFLAAPFLLPGIRSLFPGTLTVSSNGGPDVVTVGLPSGSGYSLSGIFTPVSVTQIPSPPSGASSIIVNDSADTTGRTVGVQTFGSAANAVGVYQYVEFFGISSGHNAVISYDPTDIQQVTVITGVGNDNVTVGSADLQGPAAQTQPFPTTDSLIITSAGGHDVVNIGDPQILSPVDVEDQAGTTSLVFLNLLGTTAASEIISNFTYLGAPWISIGGTSPSLVSYNTLTVSYVIPSKYNALVLATNGLVADFPFDNSSGANSIVNSYTGTFKGNAKLSSFGGGAPIFGDPTNQGLALDVNGSYVSTSLANQQTFITAATFVAWVQFSKTPAQAGHSFSIVAKSQFGNDLDLQAETDNAIHWYTNNDPSISFAVPSFSGWHMIVATVDTVAHTRALYWDGKLMTQGSNYHATRVPSVNALSIGASLVFPGRFFNGLIDDVSVYNLALGAGQIGALYEASLKPALPASRYDTAVLGTTGLVADFPFDSTSGANSIVGFYTGALVGQAQLSGLGNGAPVFGDPDNQAVFLPGNASYVTTSLAAQQPFITAATFVAWVQFSQTPAQAGHIFDIVAKSQQGDDLDLQAETDNAIHWYTDQGSNISFPIPSFSGWHMVVATFDTVAHTRVLYWDGKVMTQDNNYYAGRVASINNLSIGASLIFPNPNSTNPTAPGRFFNGSIDDVSIYNVSLGAAQISTLYQDSLPPVLPHSLYDDTVLATNGLVAEFPFDATAGANSVVGPYVGAFNGNAKLTASGGGAPIYGDPANQGLALDGNGSYVATNLGPQETFTTAATFIAWVQFSKTPAQAGHIFSIVAKSQFGNDLDLQAETDNAIHWYTANGPSLSFAIPNFSGWHMVVATVDTVAHTRALYWDGKLMTQDHNYQATRLPSVNDLSIGASLVFPGRFFIGSIDDVAVFNVALSGDSVDALFVDSLQPIK